jgi:AraC family transcriptional regulator of adaptative response/methylated-DNA-[protein]-cysteine methyltransferase
MTSARLVEGGKGERVGWHAASSPFGWVVVGATERGVCWLALGAGLEEARDSLAREFPLAKLAADPGLSSVIEAALESVDSQHFSESCYSKKLAAPQVLDLRGTEFQLRVWQALGAIPRGQRRSYSELAAELGSPKAVRAVARACAANRVAILVPCHRVVGADGGLTGYRWGIERKRMLLESESENRSLVAQETLIGD